MTFPRSDNVELVIPRAALEVIFDECDRYDADETGGRVLGTYEQRGNALKIEVNGVIEPGPSAKRTATYFKQDGTYQERVFRQVEDRDSTVEHLGNWHTHHVNGLRHLSDGDIATYRRTVHHDHHNTDFFYALLVIERKPRQAGLQRYIFKNYLLRRGDSAVYEIPASALSLVDAPLVWPGTVDDRAHPDTERPSVGQTPAKLNRVEDRDFIAEFYPKIAPFQSKTIGVYWRGPLPLLDGSVLEVVVVEDAADVGPRYTVTVRSPPEWLSDATASLQEKAFTSCRAALLTVERLCNAALFNAHPPRKGRRRWIF